MTSIILRLSMVIGTMLLGACGSSSISNPSVGNAIIGMALSADGNTLYVANADKQLIQSVNLTTLAISAYAGGANTSGVTNGGATTARFYEPFSIANVGGSLFVADTYNHGVRKIDGAQVVTTLAGNLGTVGATDGNGTAATFNYPKGITSVGTDFYVADTGNFLIRKITSTGVVTTFAGSAGSPGYVDGTTGVKFGASFAVAANSTYIFVSDSSNNSIRSVKLSDGTVTTVAGSTSGASGSIDAAGTSARFNVPAGIVSDGANLIYVADSNNHVIRKIDLSTSPATVTTVAGTAGSLTYGSADGTGAAAKFNTPTGLALDTANGILYVSDQNYTKVRKIVLSSGTVTTLNVTF